MIAYLHVLAVTDYSMEILGGFQVVFGNLQPPGQYDRRASGTSDTETNTSKQMRLGDMAQTKDAA